MGHFDYRVHLFEAEVLVEELIAVVIFYNVHVVLHTLQNTEGL